MPKLRFQPKKAHVVILAALLAVAGLIAFVTSDLEADARWQKMEDRVSELRLQAGLRKVPRTVLTGAPSHGNAWDDYAMAFDSIADNEKAVEYLRLGAQRADGRYPRDWDNNNGTGPANLSKARDLANSAAAQAKALVQSGRRQEAVDLLLDVAVFARDLMANTPLLGRTNALSTSYAAYDAAFEELRNLILSDKLTLDELTALANQLEVVDQEFPPLSAIVVTENLRIGTYMNALSTDPSNAGNLPGRLNQGGWRFAVFPRATIAEAYAQYDAQMRRLETIDQMTFDSAKREIDAIEVELGKSTNLTLPLMINARSLYQAMISHRETLAHLRLLRAGTVLLATGKIPDLVDPFGDKLLVDPANGKTKLWSVGDVGENQNRTGQWVLEISRTGGNSGTRTKFPTHHETK
jgi:hypothetical protein